MTIKGEILRLRTSFKYFTLIRNSKLRKLVKYYGIPINEISYDKNENGILLREINFLLTKLNHAFILSSYSILKEIFSKFSSTLTIDERDSVWLNVGSVKFKLYARQEVSIIKEVFIDAIYNYGFSKDTVVLDVGFNVGTSALFLALNEKVKYVIGFEPFRTTYLQGLDNLKANPKYEKKIEARNYGLGSCDQTLQIPFSFEKKGNLSTSHPESNSDSLHLESIEIRDVVKVFQEIKLKYPNYNYVLKLDCEGSEYEIVRSLYAKKQLKYFNFIMIEFHYEGPSEIESILRNSEFEYITLNRHSKYGMIYAFLK